MQGSTPTKSRNHENVGDFDRLPITVPARTIIDYFRNRNKVGIDVWTEGLRSRGATSDRIFLLIYS